MNNISKLIPTKSWKDICLGFQYVLETSPKDVGILFIARLGGVGFHMSNCLFPLDMFALDENFKVLKKYYAEPEKFPYPMPEGTSYVIETHAGVTSLKEGDVISLEEMNNKIDRSASVEDLPRTENYKKAIRLSMRKVFSQVDLLEGLEDWVEKDTYSFAKNFGYFFATSYLSKLNEFLNTEVIDSFNDNVWRYMVDTISETNWGRHALGFVDEYFEENKIDFLWRNIYKQVEEEVAESFIENYEEAIKEGFNEFVWEVFEFWEAFVNKVVTKYEKTVEDTLEKYETEEERNDAYESIDHNFWNENSVQLPYEELTKFTKKKITDVKNALRKVSYEAFKRYYFKKEGEDG